MVLASLSYLRGSEPKSQVEEPPPASLSYLRGSEPEKQAPLQQD